MVWLPLARMTFKDHYIKVRGNVSAQQIIIISYWRSMVTVCFYLVLFPRYSKILVEITIFFCFNCICAAVDDPTGISP